MPEKDRQFFDIFSRKKQIIKPEQKKQKVTIDYREKNCLVASELKKMGLNIEFKNLKVADYLIKDVAIERKTISDFISSMLNGRIIKQMQELQQYKNRILIIEGLKERDLYDDDSAGASIGVNPNAIRGFLLSIILKYNVPFIYTKNSQDTAKFIYILSKKQEKEIRLNVKKKTLSENEQKQFILESFPGIGPKTAQKLIEEFGSIKNVINAPEDSIKKILGKKSENFKRIIEESYSINKDK